MATEKMGFSIAWQLQRLVLERKKRKKERENTEHIREAQAVGAMQSMGFVNVT